MYNVCQAPQTAEQQQQYVQVGQPMQNDAMSAVLTYMNDSVARGLQQAVAGAGVEDQRIAEVRSVMASHANVHPQFDVPTAEWNSAYPCIPKTLMSILLWSGAVVLPPCTNGEPYYITAASLNNVSFIMWLDARLEELGYQVHLSRSMNRRTTNSGHKESLSRAVMSHSTARQIINDLMIGRGYIYDARTILIASCLLHEGTVAPFLGQTLTRETVKAMRKSHVTGAYAVPLFVTPTKQHA